MTIGEIKRLIEKQFPNDCVEVSGDGTHFETTVISSAFFGKTLVERHRMIYQCLGEKMGKEIHALSIQALEPSQ